MAQHHLSDDKDRLYVGIGVGNMWICMGEKRKMVNVDLNKPLTNKRQLGLDRPCQQQSVVGTEQWTLIGINNRTSWS